MAGTAVAGLAEAGFRQAGKVIGIQCSVFSVQDFIIENFFHERFQPRDKLLNIECLIRSINLSIPQVLLQQAVFCAARQTRRNKFVAMAPGPILH